MTLTAHTTTGALVAVVCGNVYVGAVAALASHLLIDMIPHWNQRPTFLHRRYIVSTDIVLSIGLIIFMAHTVSAPTYLIVVGAVAGMLPDAMWFPSEVLYGRDSPRDKNNMLHRARRLHAAIGDSHYGWGFFVELGWTALMLAILYITH